MQQAELIIAYIKGQLPEQQLRDFEQQLAADVELQAALKAYQVILAGFKGMKHQAFQDEIEAWELDKPDDESIRVMDYLEGRLEGTEKEAFEKRMAVEQDLREKLEEYQTLIEGLKGLRQNDFSAEVREWAKELPDPGMQQGAKVATLPARMRRLRYFAAAAAVLILIAASVWLLGPFRGVSADLTSYRQENYIEPAPAALVRGSEETITQAARAFAGKDYAEAVKALRSITPQDSLYVLAQYLSGHSYYRMDQFEPAVTAFSNSLNPLGGITYDLRQFDPDNAAWTRILALTALREHQPGAVSRQDIQDSLLDFLEKARRSDVYYQKGLELQNRFRQ